MRTVHCSAQKFGTVAGRSKRNALLLAVLPIGIGACAQFGTTFAYTGKDAAIDALNTQHAHFGGISNSVLVLKEENFVWPYLPAIFFEYNYLLRPRNKQANLSLGVTPEVNVFPLFSGRVSGLAELVLFAEADNKPEKGFGLRVGAGYSVFGSTIGLTESSPVLRAGFLVDNIRITYMHTLGKQIYVDHQIAVGIKFDW
jgi:hypothetical protein